MRDADKMSSSELRQLALEKEQEEKCKRVKKGKLKHDLYEISFPELNLFLNNKSNEIDYHLITKKELGQLLDDVKKHAKLVLKKGSKFVCYPDCDGLDYELWYDEEDFGIEEASSSWAKKHLDIESNDK